MILSAGLTPAWQQILVFDTFRYGEVNRACEAHWCASGKVFNAGIAAHRLGGPSLTLSPVGGSLRGAIEEEMAGLKVPCRWVAAQAPTRVCTTILERATGAMTELVEEGRALSAEELEEFREAYAEEARRAAVAVIIGSLPAGTPVTFYRDLVERTPCPAVLDFRGRGLLGVLDLRPYVVKPNREELSATLGKPLERDADLRGAMEELNRLGAQWVVVTQGSEAVWVTGGGHAWRVVPLEVERVVNPIGCGDALAAAMAWATRQGAGPLDAVRLGVAAAAANLQQLFPCRFDPTDLAERAREVRVEPLA